jgi:class 3 adenylate cyclase
MPEPLLRFAQRSPRCVADTVGRFGGFVAKYMGDGVLIYFGYPQAHEDDAEWSLLQKAPENCSAICSSLMS